MNKSINTTPKLYQLPDVKSKEKAAKWATVFVQKMAQKHKAESSQEYQKWLVK